MYLGTAEQAIEEFRQYGDNAPIPATVYRNASDWLCTACEPFQALWDESGEAVGYVGTDMDMNHVMRQRHAFLVNSALFVILFTAAAAGISVLLLNRTAIRPMKQLARETRRFAGIRDGYSPEDVMQADISSQDEIGDLYRDIQEMQRSIVDSTRRLTQAVQEKERINTELKLAAEIQSSALPQGFNPFPEGKEFELYASMTPAREVGGDFYDYFPVDENHLALVIADVSGKGIPGALFMMSAKLIISARTMSGASPASATRLISASSFSLSSGCSLMSRSMRSSSSLLLIGRFSFCLIPRLQRWDNCIMRDPVYQLYSLSCKNRFFKHHDVLSKGDYFSNRADGKPVVSDVFGPSGSCVKANLSIK